MWLLPITRPQGQKPSKGTAIGRTFPQHSAQLQTGHLPRCCPSGTLGAASTGFLWSHRTQRDRPAVGAQQTFQRGPRAECTRSRSDILSPGADPYHPEGGCPGCFLCCPLQRGLLFKVKCQGGRLKLRTNFFPFKTVYKVKVVHTGRSISYNSSAADDMRAHPAMCPPSVPTTLEPHLNVTVPLNRNPVKPKYCRD